MPGEMITGGDANSLAGSQIFSNTNKCLTCGELTANGFTIATSRAANRLVDKTLVSYSSSSILESVDVSIDMRMDSSVENQYESFQYILWIRPDNMDDFPDFDQKLNHKYLNLSRGWGTSINIDGTVEFPINDDTRKILITLYKNYPSQTNYFAVCSAGLSPSPMEWINVGFVNQTTFEITKQQYEATTNPLFRCDLSLHYSESGSDIYSTRNLKKEIKDILNKE